MTEERPQLKSRLSVDFGDGEIESQAGEQVDVPIKINIPAFTNDFNELNNSEVVTEVRLYVRHQDADQTNGFKPFKRENATQVARPGDTLDDTISFEPVTVSEFAEDVNGYNGTEAVGFGSPNAILNPDISYPDERKLYAEVDASYRATGGTLEYQTNLSPAITLRVTDPDELVDEISADSSRELDQGIEDASESTLQNAVTGQDAPVNVRLQNINYESDVPDSSPSEIAFEFERPAVSVDSKGRFITHEIIGDSTVRQKIGEEPLEIEVTGVCQEDTLQDIHRLRDATRGEIQAPQLPTGDEQTIPVQFASVSTSPLEDGGAVQLTSGDFLYEYEMSLTEVSVVADDSTAGTG